MLSCTGAGRTDGPIAMTERTNLALDRISQSTLDLVHKLEKVSQAVSECASQQAQVLQQQNYLLNWSSAVTESIIMIRDNVKITASTPVAPAPVTPTPPKAPMAQLSGLLASIETSQEQLETRLTEKLGERAQTSRPSQQRRSSEGPTISTEIERIVKRELDASMHGLKMWMLETRPSPYDVEGLEGEELPSKPKIFGRQSQARRLSSRVAQLPPPPQADHEPSIHFDLPQEDPLPFAKVETSIHSVHSDATPRCSQVTDSLLWAVKHQSVSEVRRLLQEQANPNVGFSEYKVKDGHSWTNVSALAVAVWLKNVDIIRLLVQSRADLQARYGSVVGHTNMDWSGTVVQAAVPTGRLDILKELIALSADPHDVSSNNANLLWQSCYFESEEMVEHLLELDVNPNLAAKSPDQEGLSLSPVQLATRHGCAGIVEKLLSAKASLEDELEGGASALHDALSLWQHECTYALIKSGAQLIEGGPAKRAVSLTGLPSRYATRLEQLFATPCSLVLAAAARGLQHQKEQVTRMTTEDILSFLARPGHARVQILNALFRKCKLRYRIEGNHETAIRSALVERWQPESTETFPNVASTDFSYDDFKSLYKSLEEPSAAMKSWLLDFLPSEKQPSVWQDFQDWLYQRHRDLVPVAVYRCLVPNFHEDLRTLALLCACEDLELFNSRPCQAILWEAWRTVRPIVVVDAICTLMWILLDFFFALSAHNACKEHGFLDNHACFDFHPHLYASLSVPFWVFFFLQESLQILARVRYGGPRRYLVFKFSTLCTHFRIAVIILSGYLLIQLIFGHGVESLLHGHLVLFFATSNVAKSSYFFLALIPFRRLGRPIMPVVESLIGLIALVNVFLGVLCGFISFWVILNVGDLGWYDYITNAAYFGMVAELDVVGDFGEPQKDHVFMHVVLVCMTLWIPVILMNCTVASMSLDYAIVSADVEKYYQRHLSTTVFRYTAVMDMFREIFGLRRNSSVNHRYLWYACESHDSVIV